MRWTRTELAAVREAIEVTPNFEGRIEARELLRHAYRSPRGGDIEFDAELAERLSGRLVPIDGPTAMARAKLLLAVRGPRKRGIAAAAQHRRPTLVPAHTLPTPAPAPSVAASAAA